MLFAILFLGRTSSIQKKTHWRSMFAIYLDIVPTTKNETAPNSGSSSHCAFQGVQKGALRCFTLSPSGVQFYAVDQPQLTVQSSQVVTLSKMAKTGKDSGQDGPQPFRPASMGQLKTSCCGSTSHHETTGQPLFLENHQKTKDQTTCRDLPGIPTQHSIRLF